VQKTFGHLVSLARKVEMTASDPQAAVRDLYERLLNGWNARDAAAFAELFAREGVMIGFDGSQAAGPEIKQHLIPIFRDHPTASYVAKVREVRPLGPDCMLLRAIVGMVPPGRKELNPAVNALQSLVAERQGESWRIVLYQNTPAQYHGRPELAEDHTAEVEKVRAAGITVG
jgi:uncharacterized protein (TIGR02246 family)